LFNFFTLEGPILDGGVRVVKEVYDSESEVTDNILPLFWPFKKKSFYVQK